MRSASFPGARRGSNPRPPEWKSGALVQLSYGHITIIRSTFCAAAGAPPGAEKTHGTGSRVRQAGGFLPRRVSTRTALLYPNPSCQKRERRPAFPGTAGRQGAFVPGASRPAGLQKPYAGPPPTGFPKSTLPDRESHHGYIASTRPLRREARPASVPAHSVATPRMLCEGACVRLRVGKVCACIVRVWSIAFTARTSGQQKRSRDPPALCEDLAGPRPVGLHGLP